MFFTFTYMKGTRVVEFDPPNFHFMQHSETLSPIEAERELIIHGANFLDITDEMRCRVSFSETEQPESLARYINNHTLACPVPAPPSHVELPFGAVIELSFNFG